MLKQVQHDEVECGSGARDFPAGDREQARRSADPVEQSRLRPGHPDLPARRAALFAQLAEAAGQVWMTVTEPGLCDGIGGSASLFTVAGGKITSA